MLRKLLVGMASFTILLVLLSFGAAQSGEKVTLRFPSWQWGQPGYDEFFQEAIKAFEQQHPNVTFQKIPIPSQNYDDQLVKMFVANDPPEIVQFTLRDFNKFAAAGWLEPLDTLLANTDLEEGWVPFLWNAGKVNGKMYGLYISGTARMLFYNKKMFAEAGLQVPKTPAEMVEDAKKLTKRAADGKVIQYGLSIDNKPDLNMAPYGLTPLVVGLGGNWAEDGQPSATSPEVHQAIDIMQQLLQSGAAPKGADRIGARQIFWEGKAAMLIEGPWIMTSILKENPDLIQDVGVAPIPFPNQAAALSNGFAIAKDQKHKDLAWEFIQMIASPEWMNKYVLLTGVTSALNQPLSDAAIKKYPWLPKFAQAKLVGKNLLPDGMEVYSPEINKIIANDVAGVFFGSKSIDAAQKEIQADMEKLLQ